MTSIENKTVREIAIENPATVRIFESLGIDYCCGGRRSLEEACNRAHVPLPQALELIATAEPEARSSEEDNWPDASLSDLIQQIVNRHHSFVRQEVPRLEALCDKVVSRHGEAHPELASIQALFGALGQELSAHMMKEEHILFPYLEKMETAVRKNEPFPASCFGTIQMPIARMLADHDDAGELTAKIRSLANGFQAPEGACPSYHGLYHGLEEFERDLHRHIHLENNILFPRAVEMERGRQEAA